MSNFNSRIMSSPSKRPTPVTSKDFIVENKLQVLKKSMARQAESKPNSEFIGLPEIRESRQGQIQPANRFENRLYPDPNK